MSGRAGRRGIDDRGIVILIVDEKMGPDVGKELLKVLNVENKADNYCLLLLHRLLLEIQLLESVGCLLMVTVF